MTRGVFLLLLALSIASGCAPWPSTKLPPERLEAPRSPGQRSKRLLVLIHGHGDNPSHFRKAGFFDALASSGADIDAVAVHAHIGYYYDRVLGQRLQEHVVQRARDEGYEEIYMLGISRGGLGAMAYARRYGHELSGLALFAPFLGPDLILDEIRDAGGLADWEAHPPIEDIELVLQWLQGYARGEDRPALFLGCGEDDDFMRNVDLVRQFVPEGRFVTAAGGHDWKAWRTLWQQLLSRDPFGWIPAAP